MGTPDDFLILSREDSPPSVKYTDTILLYYYSI